MTAPSPRKCFSLPPDEKLYRRLRANQWSLEGQYVDVSAFLDANWDTMRGLSVYASSIATPLSILVQLAAYKGVRRDLGNPSTLELWEMHGYGIAAVTVADIIELGLDFLRNEDGSIRLKADGHVDIVGGHRLAADLAIRAIPLGKFEIFGSSP
jgi:hypothetical protein